MATADILTTLQKDGCLTAKGVAALSSALETGKLVFNFYDRDAYGADTQTNCRKTIEALAPAFAEKRMTSVLLWGAYFPDVDFLPESLMNTDSLSLKAATLSAKDLAVCADGMDKFAVSELSVTGTRARAFDGGLHPLADRLAESEKAQAALTSLSLPLCELTDKGAKRLTDDILPSLKHLKKLDLTQVSFADGVLNKVVAALPENLEDLSLKNAMKTGDEQTQSLLAEKLTRMTALKKLSLSETNDWKARDVPALIEAMPPSVREIDLSKNFISKKDIARIVSVLPDSLRILNLSETELFREEEELLLEKMEKPGALLHGTHLVSADSEKAFPTEFGQRFLKAEDINADNAAFAETLNGKTAAQAFQAAADPKDGLHAAVYAGLTGHAVEKLKAAGISLTAEDWTTPNAIGQTLGEASVKRGLTATLMNPALYANAKTFQAAYNALPDAGKAQLDGKDGRPSFIRMKNQMMLAAVRNATAQAGR